MYRFYTQTNSLNLFLIPYFSVTTGRKNEDTLTFSHQILHIK